MFRGEDRRGYRSLSDDYRCRHAYDEKSNASYCGETQYVEARFISARPVSHTEVLSTYVDSTEARDVRSRGVEWASHVASLMVASRLRAEKRKS